LTAEVICCLGQIDRDESGFVQTKKHAGYHGFCPKTLAAKHKPIFTAQRENDFLHDFEFMGVDGGENGARQTIGSA
jgi:hypothetical protein